MPGGIGVSILYCCAWACGMISRVATEKTAVRTSQGLTVFSNSIFPPCFRHRKTLNRGDFQFLGSFLRKGGGSTGLQNLFPVKASEKLDKLCDHSGPSCLVAGPQTRPVIAMEVFVEQDVVLPLGISLEPLRTSVHRPPAGFIPQEDRFQSMSDIPSYLKEVHQLAGASWALDLEVVAVIEIEREQGPYQQRVHRHPDRPAPVGVAAEHAGVGFRRQIIHPVFLAFHVDDKGMLVVIFGKRPYPVRA